MASAGKLSLVDELVAEFRRSGNQDDAFDVLAAEVLRLNQTDLHCVNIIQNAGGMSAGDLAVESGLTTGAVTGVIDRLERAGFARRVADPDDRRRIRVEVTPEFYRQAGVVWGPVNADWEATLSQRFTVSQLQQALEFLKVVNEISARHLERLRAARSG